jgi:CTP:phosphocholine cytidylyltransferase-like protein
VKAIILSAGKSSRLKELTKELPKTCLKINDEDSIPPKEIPLLVPVGLRYGVALFTPKFKTPVRLFML